MIRKEFIYLAWYLLLSLPIVILYINFSMKTRKEWLSLTGGVRPASGEEDDRRGYVRLDSAFPVEFQKIDEEGRVLDVRQGFTRDISRTGIRVETYVIRGKKLEEFTPNETRMKLVINIPAEEEATVATGTVKWIMKSEDMAVDRYSMGVYFDDIPKPDIDNIMKYVLWFRRKSAMLGVLAAVGLILLTTLFSTIIILSDEKAQLQRQIRLSYQERAKLDIMTKTITKEKAELSEKINALSQDREVLLAKLRISEKTEAAPSAVSPDKVASQGAPEEADGSVTKPPLQDTSLTTLDDAPEAALEAESALEPVVELRKTVREAGEEMVTPNITKKMVESEKDVYKTIRDYILAQEIQRLDRYCSTHASSIYHAAGLFALAELRYKNSSMEEMTLKAYRDVINLYPRSKYASYASHRMEQIDMNLPYAARDLRYFSTHYNLPAFYDYRELEPYKE